MIRVPGGEQGRVELRGSAAETIRQESPGRGSVSLGSGRSGSVTPGRGFSRRISLRSAGIVRSIYTRLRLRPSRTASRLLARLRAAIAGVIRVSDRSAARDEATMHIVYTTHAGNETIHGAASYSELEGMYGIPTSWMSPAPSRNANTGSAEMTAPVDCGTHVRASRSASYSVARTTVPADCGMHAKPSRTPAESNARMTVPADCAAHVRPSRTTNKTSYPSRMITAIAVHFFPKLQRGAAETDSLKQTRDVPPTKTEGLEPARGAAAQTSGSSDEYSATFGNGIVSADTSDSSASVDERHYWTIVGTRLVIYGCNYSVDNGELTIE